MKPETKCAGLPWGPLEGKSSKQPYCNAFPNLILARDVTVLGCTGFGVDSANISCTYGKGLIKTAIWGHFYA